MYKILVIVAIILGSCAHTDKSVCTQMTHPPVRTESGWIITAKDVGDGKVAMLVDAEAIMKFDAWVTEVEKWNKDTWEACGPKK